MTSHTGSLVGWATKQQNDYVFKKSELTEVQFPKNRKLSERKGRPLQILQTDATKSGDTMELSKFSSSNIARSHIDMVKIRHGFPPYRPRERSLVMDVCGDDMPTHKGEFIQHFSSLPACFTTDRLGFKDDDVEYYSDLARVYRGPLITDPSIWETLRDQDIYYETYSTRVIMQRMLHLLIERGDIRASIRELESKSNTPL
ncbi:hypothetical protein XU18_0905 [Perkinsela sp. CCAP 1560/4]|nr:hypothetical protein XU18_1754 [Perkinsela sp. CCAP 1560/4]KNH08619.1 hypothetical protein XU18_0905 [Perkinsela sp. CCAP 1560/4]|eukprot:KNH07577.1 hypothetical protein XU18_1754 [Perkinsela sp. CCAP 1560/4]